MKLSTLYARSDSERREMANHVLVTRVKSGKMEDGRIFIAAQTTSRMRLDSRKQLYFVPMRERTTYVTIVTFDHKMHVVASCSCADFKYMWETQLHDRWGAANIEYSDGQPPTIKNPLMKPGMCKHLCALYLRIRSMPNI